ncbi:VOC family protein [Streptomyces sp. 4F14]|uniref:VOC family protein n=1 Tax=Streptomyces sp. 4F14 TaxID=3394380 RepID=UPI003A85032B
MAENRASGYGEGAAAHTGGYGEGVPCWVDAQLPDLDAGKRFYGELFGWTFDVPDDPGVDHGGSLWAWKDGRPVAALAPKSDGRMPTVWTVYFATPDIRRTAGRIVAVGGQVVMAPFPVGRLGAAALVADPEGAVFGLWQGERHPGFGVRHTPSTFVWAELYARDIDAVNSFYGGLFHEALFGEGARPDFGRAPVSDVFPAEMPPHFVVHFGVEDCAVAVRAVVRLGGRVQAGPFATSYGIAAVVSDNQGASFALLQRENRRFGVEPA